MAVRVSIYEFQGGTNIQFITGVTIEEKSQAIHDLYIPYPDAEMVTVHPMKLLLEMETFDSMSKKMNAKSDSYQ